MSYAVSLTSNATKDHDRNQEATVWCGNLDQQATEELVWEMCVQAGPVVDVTMPRDKITYQHSGYAFVEFKTPEDADYAIRILNMIKLYGKHLKVNKAAKDKKEGEDGGEQFAANLFVRNLHPDVDNKFLYDTFSSFGCVLTAKVMTEDDSATSKGYAFVSFDTFEVCILSFLFCSFNLFSIRLRMLLSQRWRGSTL